MRKTLTVLAALAVMACDRANEREGTDTSAIGGDVDIGLTKDTVNVPVFSLEKDTIVVDKPVVSGRKPVEVKRPTVERKP